MNMSDRLGEGENVDLLAADVLNLTLAGLRSGIALQSPPGIVCPLVTSSDPITDVRAS
jgi:hypothetical protein